MKTLDNALNRLKSVDQSIEKRYKFLFVTGIFLALQTIFILFYSDYDLIQKGIVSQLIIFFTVSIIVFLYPIVYRITLSNLPKIISVPFGYVISSFLLLRFFPNLNILFKLSFSIFSTFIFYYLVLATNVFLVVEERGRNIPLVRPAKTVFLFIEIITLFFVLTNTFKMILPGAFLELSFIFHMFVVFISTYFFALQYWWSQNLEQELNSLVGNESFVIALVMGISALTISFFPLESFFKALALTTVYYIFISFFQAVALHRVYKGLYIEFLSIILAVVAFLLIS